MVLVGIAAGVFATGNMLAVPLVLTFGLVALLLSGARNIRAEDRVFIFRLALGALLLRLLLIVATHSLETGFIHYINSSDAFDYENIGRLISGAWHDGRTLTVERENYGYYYWNAIFYYLVGYYPDLLRIFNSILAVCTGFSLYFISLKLSGPRAAKISFVIAAFFPSSILWSSLNLKDSLIIFLITLIIRLNLDLMEKFKPGKVLLMTLLLMALVSLRFYAGILLAACITVSHIFSGSKLPFWRKFACIIAIFLMLGFALQQMGYGFMGTDYVFNQNIIEAVGEQHQKGARGEASFAGDVALDSYGGALRYLPVGIFYFIFAPLPWQSMGQIRFITIPEMFFLYFLYIYFVVGVKHLWRVQRGSCLFLLLVIVSFGLIYSLGASNIGGLYRVRLQAIMPAFILMSEGLQRSRVLTRIAGRLTGRTYRSV